MAQLIAAQSPNCLAMANRKSFDSPRHFPPGGPFVGVNRKQFVRSRFENSATGGIAEGRLFAQA